MTPDPSCRANLGRCPARKCTMRFMATATAVLIVALQGGPLQAADETPPRYSLKQDEPPVGSNIRRNVVSGSLVPLDKAYAELSPQEQAQVKSQYEHMGPDDEPPFPVNGLRPIYRAIGTAQQQLRVSVNMSLAVDVNSEGEATSVSVLQSTDADMANIAASVLLLQKYKPARCNGSPCAMQFPFRITLEKRL
jgi:hypothetical protein